MGKPRERGVNISAILPLGCNEAKEEAEGDYPAAQKTRSLHPSLSFKCRLHIMKASNNKLSPKSVHGGARAAAVAGECAL